MPSGPSSGGRRVQGGNAQKKDNKKQGGLSQPALKDAFKAKPKK